MEDDEPPSTSTSSESPPEAQPKEPSSSRRRKPSRRDRRMDQESDKESQTQYCKGFFDALRVVQSSNQFKFEGGAVSPVLPALTPTFNAITPASASDMHTIVMSILGNTPMTSAPNTIPPLSSPTSLLPLDDLSMKLLASTALPGPPIISSSNSPDSSSTIVTQAQVLPQIGSLPLIHNMVTSTTASTSRPDKLNLTPPRQTFDHFGSNNALSDDSDGGFDSRSASRAGDSRLDGMGMGDQEKKKLERKRARNRQAASKCRQKKMDRIKELEDQVSHEKHRGQRLDAELVELNRALDNFRRMVERHSVNGCPSIRV